MVYGSSKSNTLNRATGNNNLNKAIVEAQELLTSFVFKDRLFEDFSTAFGWNYDRNAALLLIGKMTTSMEEEDMTL